MKTPDVVVLGGGGVLGEAWMSAVLAGLAEQGDFDAAEASQFIGTSAGSIVAAALDGGVDPRTRLGDWPEPPPVEADMKGDSQRPGGPLAILVQAGSVAAAPIAGIALKTAEPGGRFLRSAALSRAPVGKRSLSMLHDEIMRHRPEWDGRLRISAVDMESGRRVMFGAPGAPEATVGEAVQASCSIPGVFHPVEIGGRRYVDGGVWSPTNMDTADAGSGTTVLCLNPTGSMRPARGSLAGAMGPVSRSIAAVEAAALRRRGADVTIVSPDAGAHEAMGPNLMDSQPRGDVIRAGIEQGRSLAKRA